MIYKMLLVNVLKSLFFLINLFAAAWKIAQGLSYLYMSETSGEEVDYGSFDSFANPNTDSDHAWSASDNDSLE